MKPFSEGDVQLFVKILVGRKEKAVKLSCKVTVKRICASGD